MDGSRNGGENNDGDALPFAGGEPQFIQDLRRNLPYKLYRVGILTSATAVGGLAQQLAVVAASSQLPVVVLLLVALFGALGTIYTGYRLAVEVAPTGRWRKAGVAVYFLCLLLLVAVVNFVGSDYCELALNFIDN